MTRAVFIHLDFSIFCESFERCGAESNMILPVNSANFWGNRLVDKWVIAEGCFKCYTRSYLWEDIVWRKGRHGHQQECLEKVTLNRGV